MDYCSNVYQSMLNKQMSKDLEKLQVFALRIIYGFQKSQEDLLELSGLTTLEERRKHLFDNFCKKIFENSRFKQDWLEERIFTGPNIRSQKIILEKYAKTNRLYNSPLYTIRRRINDLYVV